MIKSNNEFNTNTYYFLINTNKQNKHIFKNLNILYTIINFNKMDNH